MKKKLYSSRVGCLEEELLRIAFHLKVTGSEFFINWRASRSLLFGSSGFGNLAWRGEEEIVMLFRVWENGHAGWQGSFRLSLSSLPTVVAHF